MKKLILAPIAVAALAIPSVAFAQASGIDDFKFSTGQTSFTFDNDWYWPDPVYFHSQNVEAGTSGVNLVSVIGANGLDPSPSGLYTGRQAYTANDAATDNSYWYSFYRQPNSVVVGFLGEDTDPSGHNYFIKDIVGTNATTNDLPATAGSGGSYTYGGDTIWHHVDNEGTLTYTIEKDTTDGKVYGSGSFQDLELHWTLFSGYVRVDFDVSGDLDKTEITTQSQASPWGNYLGVQTANVSNLTAGAGWKDALIVTAVGSVDAKYDLGVFGTGANDVAGRVTLNDALGSFGIAGVKTN